MSEREVPGAITEMVRYHEKLLLRGNGKPGLCTRMETQENAMLAATERLNKTDERTDAQFDAIDDRFDKLDTRITAEVAKVTHDLQTRSAEVKKDAHEQNAATNKRLDVTMRLFWTIVCLIIASMLANFWDMRQHLPDHPTAGSPTTTSQIRPYAY